MSLSTLDVASPLPAGVANNLSWSAGPTGSGFASYTASISVPTVTASSALSCSLQCNASNVADASNCWLMTAYPTAAQVTFVAAGNPATPSNYPISWAVTRN